MNVLQHRKRLFSFRRLIAAAGIVAAGTCLFESGQSACAQTTPAASTTPIISWTIEFYSRFTSKDGQRNWLDKGIMERSYMAPGRYRDTTYDEEGNVAKVEIQDVPSGKFLRLDMKRKTALVQQKQGHPMPPGYEKDPFTGVKRFAASNKAQAAGQRNINGVLVNVVRYRNDVYGGRENYEIWTDANTQQLVGHSSRIWLDSYPGPKDGYFDPATDPDLDKPAEKGGSGRIHGAVYSNINLDAKLGASLFSLTPPAGFEVTESPKAL